jgi:hypothetical protein
LEVLRGDARERRVGHDVLTSGRVVQVLACCLPDIGIDVVDGRAKRDDGDPFQRRILESQLSALGQERPSDVAVAAGGRDHPEGLGLHAGVGPQTCCDEGGTMRVGISSSYVRGFKTCSMKLVAGNVS